MRDSRNGAGDSERRVVYGRRLRREREQAGLSQRDLAAEANVAQAVVSRAEGGQEVAEEALVLIEAALDMPVADPLAPRDPVRRLAYFDERSRLLAGARPADGLTFGSGRVPKAAA